MKKSEKISGMASVDCGSHLTMIQWCWSLTTNQVLFDGKLPTTRLPRQAIKKNQSKQSSANYDYSNAQDLSLQTVARARAKKQPINIIGEITVPAIGMTIPIANGVDNTTLALAAGTLRPNMKMGEGNYALAGHNMANGSKVLFSPLYSKSKVGQKVYITDLKNVYEYKNFRNGRFISPSQGWGS